MKDSADGFLLLTSRLGSIDRKPLSVAQLRVLSERVRDLPYSATERVLEPSDLVSVGCTTELAVRVISLLEDKSLLRSYLRRGEKMGCLPLARNNAEYPLIVRKRLGLDSPGCLWTKGDRAILKMPSVALVGNRDLKSENLVFASEVGRQAAAQGVALVSGNAKGADNAAQEACLSAGGKVICIVADSLEDQNESDNILYISEEDYDQPFSPQRALRRNRVIHALGTMAFVAQCTQEKGGTWDGTVKNLRAHWSPVLCFRDGSETIEKLLCLGASPVCTDDLLDFSALARTELNLFER